MHERPGAVLDQLRAGQQRFLDGHLLHPRSDRLRMLAVESGQTPVAAAYYNLHITSIEWMGALMPMPQG